jgi:hypothetical protein
VRLCLRRVCLCLRRRRTVGDREPAMAGVHMIALERLVDLKLASGTGGFRRLRDLAEVQDLIIRLDLSESSGDALGPSLPHIGSCGKQHRRENYDD